ncbi:MAG: DUF2933 domain-containing protein [Actinomycetota bacterium]
MEKMLRMCLNWKVIGGLAAVGVGVWLVAPNLLIGALPLLLIAVCPLSMVLMMKGMDRGQHSSQPEGAKTDPRVAPSREVRIAELHAEREVLDSKITALEAEETDVQGASPVAESGEGRDHQR